MTWAPLAFTLMANLTLALSLVLSHRERSRLIAAMLQTTGQPDAARRLAPMSKASAEAAVKAQIEINESGVPFSAANPWGSGKPLGI